MAYYPDLSDYCYGGRADGSLNVGWLDNIHLFNTGIVSEKFLDGLWAFLHIPVNEYRGFHVCELCSLDPDYIYFVCDDITELLQDTIEHTKQLPQ
ncbi:MAG: hypothetical protein LBI03_04115 [Clostridiales bacterium]|jgi:hypothetical protein|nr:hypothetical protein [Clostridiales bacterium]